MSNNFINNKESFNYFSLDYNNELLLKYSSKYNKLLINNYNEELFLGLLSYILPYFMINKMKTLILSNNILNDLREKVIGIGDIKDIKLHLNKQSLNPPKLTKKNVISKVNLLSRNINNKIDKLINISNFFTLGNDKALPLLEKYKLTTKGLDKYDNLFGYYIKFQLERSLNKFNYIEIKSSVDDILNTDIIGKYIKYRRVSDNNFIQILEEPINYNNLSLIISKITNIIKNKEVKTTFSNSEYTNDFIETYLVNPKMKQDDLKELVNLVNLKYNYHLLRQKRRKLIGVFTIKKNVIENERNLNKFNKAETKILEEYKNNLINLNNNLDNISFLKNILSKELFNKIYEKLIKGEDIKEDLVLYRKILNINYEVKDIINDIKNLSPLKKKLLDFCYNSIEDKKDIYDFIKSIPKLKLYLEIEEQESRNSDILNNYTKYDNLLSDLSSDVCNRKEFVLNEIDDAWSNISLGQVQINDNIKTSDSLSNQKINKVIPCIISSLDDINLLEANTLEFKFDKIIILDNRINVINDNIELIESLGKEVIIFSENEKVEVEYLKDYEIMDFPDSSNFKSSSSFKYDYITEEIKLYMESLGYIVELNVPLDEFNIKLIIRDKKHSKTIAIEIDTEVVSMDEVYMIKDLYLNEALKHKGIDLYRIWSRDWWISKRKVLLKLERYLYKNLNS